MNPGSIVTFIGYGTFIGYTGASYTLMDVNQPDPPLAWVIGLIIPIVIIAAGIIIEEYHRR